MTDTSDTDNLEEVCDETSSTSPAKTSKFDRSIVEGPLGAAVWKIAWPTMLTNAIAGMQGMVDHVLVGNLVGFKANAAIGVNRPIELVDQHEVEFAGGFEGEFNSVSVGPGALQFPRSAPAVRAW